MVEHGMTVKNTPVYFRRKFDFFYINDFFFFLVKTTFGCEWTVAAWWSPSVQAERQVGKEALGPGHEAH